MPFISPGHFWMILLLLIVVLIIWGPGKLPDVGAGMGRAIREFKKASTDMRESVMNASPTEHPQVPPPAPNVPPAASVPPAATPPRSEVTEEPKAPV